MTYFFRYEPDGVHNMSIFIIRIVFIAVLLFAHTQKHNKKLLKISLILGLFLQVVLFFWYSGNPVLFMKEGLPMYHCRLSAIMLAVSYFLKKEKWMRYFAWLGLLGAIIAFSFQIHLLFYGHTSPILRILAVICYWGCLQSSFCVKRKLN